MKYIQKDIHYSITKKEQGILKIRRKYNNLSGCRTLSLFTYTTFYVFSYQCQYLLKKHIMNIVMASLQDSHPLATFFLKRAYFLNRVGENK